MDIAKSHLEALETKKEIAEGMQHDESQYPVEVTREEVSMLITKGYKRGFNAGVITGMLIIGAYFALYAIQAHYRLMDEVKATNYYYSLTQK